MAGPVTVLTTCHPDYLTMLPECAASIASQIVQPAYHRISVDFRREGPVPQLNEMARSVSTEFVAQLAADDLADPEHLETLLAASEGADVVYTWCRVSGRDGWNPNSLFNAERLKSESYIPATSLIRTSLLRDLGYWRPDSQNGWEDWDFFRRAVYSGAVFRCVPTITWTYIFHGRNATFRGFGK